MKYQAYAEYKDSGVEWLGDVPVHWDIVRLKNILQCRITDGPHMTPEFVDDGVPFLSVDGIQDGELKFDGCRYISEANHTEYRMKALPIRNDLLMGKAASTGKIARVKVDFEFSIWSSLALIRLDYTVSNSIFFEQSLKSPIIQAQIENLCTANTQKNISMDDIPKLILTRPPLEEQTKIANFLDHETAKIDTLIEKQQQLIQLLKEKRQAVISHAVTKGLNPDVPMRDSGVEWLGEVPAHWTVTRAKFVSSIFVPQRNKPELNDEYGVNWATMEDMRCEYIEYTKQFVDDASAKIAGSKTLKAGAVIASCVGNFGVATINKIDVIINQQLQAFIPTSIKAEYLRETISISKDYFESIGTAATLVYVNQQGFENLPVLVPPIEEQELICERIKKECSKFDRLIDLCDVAINSA